MRDELDRARSVGDLGAVRSIATTALKSDSDELRVLVDVAIHLRYSDPDLSQTVLRHIIRKDPTSGYGHYELAFSLLLSGDHLEAIDLLENMLRFHPTDSRAIVLHARLLCGIGASDLAVERLQSARSLLPADESVLVEQFAAFIGRLPCGKAVYLATREPFEDATRVKERVETAVRDGHGFSLVRFGDGEGVFFRVSAEEERSLAHLYRHVRTDRARVWFGDSLDAVMPTFGEQASRISDVFDDCDVAGIPYPAWLQLEYRILSFSGVVGLGNIVRHLSVARRRPALTSQLIHIDLARSGALRAILTQLTTCAIITCFPEAKAFLMSTFGLANVEVFKVPGERLFSNVIGAVASEGQHYPDVFDSLMRALDRPLHGRLFLVAAGMLGKFYCARIKASGGVALDIGSLIDAALGKATRPGYSKEQPLEL